MTEGNTKVVTGKVRLGYPSLFKARASNEKQEPKYSVEILIPKTDTKTVAKIREAQNAAATSERAKQKFKTDKVPVWGSATFNPMKWTDTLRDGDDPDEQDGHEERAGHWFMGVRSSTKFKPGVVNKEREPILDESEVYGGVYGRVSMEAFPFEAEGKKGISFGLNNVLVLGYGEPFGAPREKAEEAFDDDFEDESPEAAPDGDDLI